MEKTELRDVSDTAFWVAIYRAQESVRPDALFNDPYAAKLSGDLGQRLTVGLDDNPYTSWSIILRTYVIDSLIQEMLIKKEIDAVINLGAGLDTRPYRLDLDSSFPWIEVDYPHILKFKNEQLKNEKPRCQLERVALDLGDLDARKKFFAESGLKHPRALILTEGVLPYLTEAQIVSLGHDLHSVFQFWLVDYFSPMTIPYLMSKKRRKKMKNTPFQFFPREWFSFFARIGWVSKEIRYLGEVGERLQRPLPLPGLLKFFSRFFSEERKKQMRQAMAYVVLEKK